LKQNIIIAVCAHGKQAFENANNWYAEPKSEPTQTLPNLLPPDWGSPALPKFKRTIVEDYQDGSEVSG
jgi:hypothetical protein